MTWIGIAINDLILLTDRLAEQGANITSPCKKIEHQIMEGARMGKHTIIIKSSNIIFITDCTHVIIVGYMYRYYFCVLMFRVKSTGQPSKASMFSLASAVMACTVLPAGPITID